MAQTQLTPMDPAVNRESRVQLERRLPELHGDYQLDTNSLKSKRAGATATMAGAEYRTHCSAITQQVPSRARGGGGVGVHDHCTRPDANV